MSILRGAEADAVRKWATALAHELPFGRGDDTLVSGDAGFALLYQELGDDAPRPAAAVAEAALEAIEKGRLRSPSFFDGFPGVIWAAERVIGEFDTTDVDDVLLTILSRPSWRGPYDLVGGLTGLGVYALDSPRRAAIASRIIQILESQAVLTDQGLSWFTPASFIHPRARPTRPDGVFDLGLAHGIAGVLALLARAVLSGVERERSRKLLAEAVPSLLAQRLLAGSGSHFPDQVIVGRPAMPSRLAWCYGDLAVAAALYTAGIACDEEQWVDIAEDVARDAATRPQEQSGVVDAPLCHGAAGVAYLLLRFHMATGDPSFAEASRRWFRELTRMRETEAFLTLRTDDEGNPKRETVDGLLEGKCGIALALLAATRSEPPRWDRLLLIDLPTRGGA